MRFTLLSDLSQLVDATSLLLQEKSSCQQIESDSEIDDVDSAHDEVLMDAVSDLLPAFAKSMGAQFAPIFAQLFEPLMKFAVSSQPITFTVRNKSQINILTLKCRNLLVLLKIGLW